MRRRLDAAVRPSFQQPTEIDNQRIFRRWHVNPTVVLRFDLQALIMATMAVLAIGAPAIAGAATTAMSTAIK